MLNNDIITYYPSYSFIMIYGMIIIISSLYGKTYPKILIGFVLLCSLIPFILPNDMMFMLERCIIFLHLTCSVIWKYIDYIPSKTNKVIIKPRQNRKDCRKYSNNKRNRSSFDITVHTLAYQGITNNAVRVPPFTFNRRSLYKLLILSIIYHIIIKYIIPSVIFNLTPLIGYLATRFIAALLLALGNAGLFCSLSIASQLLFSLFGYSLEPFYNKFWLSSRVSQFWRRWNTPLQRVLYRYIFYPLNGVLGIPKILSTLIVFLVSSAIHWIPIIAFIPNASKIVAFITWNIFFILQYIILITESLIDWLIANHALCKYNKARVGVGGGCTVTVNNNNNVLYYYVCLFNNPKVRRTLTLLWVSLSSAIVHVPILSYMGY